MKHLALVAVLAVVPAVAYAGTPVEDVVDAFRSAHADSGKFTCTDNSDNNYPSWTDSCGIYNSMSSDKVGRLHVEYAENGDPTMVGYTCTAYQTVEKVGGWISDPPGMVYDNKVVIDEEHQIAHKTFHTSINDAYGMEQILESFKRPTC